MKLPWGAACLCLLSHLLSPAAHAYSVLTHEAIIDSAWEQSIKPVLLKRFPQSTEAQLLAAHASTYAGCIIQDMGYYPFGNKLFSDLVHYVRSGDFVVNLIHEAQTLDEYAFALGALAHYAADTQGHAVAVNRSVPIEYPKLRRKFGPEVTYGDDPAAHLKVEFSFDVLQVARGNYAPQAYHDFIGFQVQKELLERGFHDTYSLQMPDIFADLDLALGTYRHVVSSTIPGMTRVAWKIKSDELLKARPGITRRAFIYNLSKASYRKEWDGRYRRPGPGATILAFIIRVIPKIGPLRALTFKTPTPQTERLFEDSFDLTLREYRQLLGQAAEGKLMLKDVDLDTGRPTQPTEYMLADKTYSKLAIHLADKPASMVDPQLRDNVLSFYRDPDLPFATKKNHKQWKRTVAAIEKLKSETAAAGSRSGAAGESPF